MRSIIIAGNWKLNHGPTKSKEVISSLKSKLEGQSLSSKVVLCAPYVSLSSAIEASVNSSISIGAQNCYTEDSGAFTGEISAELLKELGCAYVILGHSERREYFNESDAFINQKTKKVLEKGLIPILCVGEVLEQRKAGEHVDIVNAQITAGVEGISAEDLKKVVIAYEPVWAIGTGETASPEQAQEMHAEIRSTLTTLYGASVAEEVSILYGGSMKPGNAAELLSQNDVDGGLIGGASLEADSFYQIIEAAEAL